MRSRAFQALRPLGRRSSSLGNLQRACQSTPLRFQVQQSASIATTIKPRRPPITKPSPPASKPAADPPAAAAATTTAPATAPSVDLDAPPVDFGAAIAATSPSLSNGNGEAIDWSSSFHGLSTVPFEPRVAEILMRRLDAEDVEIKPDGIIYLPEIKYRRILNAAFGPGGWGLAPRGELIVGEKVVTREYALIVHGRFVAQARGECQYFSEETIPTAGEGCKSNALMRCCKDLGIASELWDPRFIRQYKNDKCQEVWVEHVVNKKRRQIWLRKDSDPVYPYALVRKIKI